MHTMEFNYSDYLVRITFNPTDIIVRFEHNKTLRCYEQTFFERDFPQTSMMGGMKFLEKVLSAVFAAPKFDEIYIDKFTATTNAIQFQVILNIPLFANPIVLPFELAAQRKSTGNIELSELNRKMKEMNDKMTKVLDEKLSAMDSLAERINELEGRCGDVITLPGCIFAIPTNLTSLILVRDRTCLPDGRSFSMMVPGQCTAGNWSNNSAVNWNIIFQGVNHTGHGVTFNPSPDGDVNIFPFTSS